MNVPVIGVDVVDKAIAVLSEVITAFEYEPAPAGP